MAGVPLIWCFLCNVSKGRHNQTSLTIDLGDRRLGVQLGDSLHKGPGKPLLEGKTSM